MADSRTEYQRQWYLKNREKKLEQSRARYAANREVRIKQNKEYHKLHPEVAVKGWRKYQANHPDRCRKANRDWYRRNVEQQRERVRIKNQIAYQKNKMKLLEKNREWRSRNKECIRAKSMKRKALLLGASVNLKKIREWMDSVTSKPTARCYYCDTIIPSSLVHFDHIVALSKGGAHSVDNLCVSCGPCNLSKKAKSISAWIRVGQQVLAL